MPKRSRCETLDTVTLQSASVATKMHYSWVESGGSAFNESSVKRCQGIRNPEKLSPFPGPHSSKTIPLLLTQKRKRKENPPNISLGIILHSG